MGESNRFSGLLVLVGASVAVATLVGIANLIAAKDDSSAPSEVEIPEFDTEELASRLARIRPYDGNLNAEGDEIPIELSYLMSAYALDVDGAVAQLHAQAAANVASNWLQEMLGENPHLGGMRIDHGRGGHLVVLVSDSELGREIVSATAELLPIWVQMTSVSEKELETIAQQAVEMLDLVDSDSRLGTGVPYFTVSVELSKERVVIGQSSLAPDDLSRKLESLAYNPLVVVEDLGPVLMDHGGDS